MLLDIRAVTSNLLLGGRPGTGGGTVYSTKTFQQIFRKCIKFAKNLQFLEKLVIFKKR